MQTHRLQKIAIGACITLSVIHSCQKLGNKLSKLRNSAPNTEIFVNAKIAQQLAKDVFDYALDTTSINHSRIKFIGKTKKPHKLGRNDHFILSCTHKQGFAKYGNDTVFLSKEDIFSTETASYSINTIAHKKGLPQIFYYPLKKGEKNRIDAAENWTKKAEFKD